MSYKTPYSDQTTGMPPWYLRLTRVCHRLGRPAEEAEDIVQDAYVRFLEYRQSHHIRNEEALLSRIVTNLAINHYHHARLLSATFESLEVIQQESDFVDESPGVDRVLIARERLRKVERTLSRVSERTFQIFVAHRAGFSYKEIAAELSISGRAVQKHIVRATTLLGMKPRPPSRF